MTTIENRRFALFVALGVVLFLMWQAWQKDFPDTPAPSAAPDVASLDAPAEIAPDARSAPEDPGEIPSAPAAVESPAPPDAAASTPRPPARYSVQTDLVRAEISGEGGQLRRVELLGYPVAKKQPDTNVALLDDRADRWFVLQSGLAGTKSPLVSHRDPFTAAQSHFVLRDGEDALEVVLTHESPSGLRVEKRYRFERGRYVVRLTQHVENTGPAAVSLHPYVQMWRTPFAAGDEPPFIQSFMGLGFYEQKDGGPDYRFRKVHFDDLADEPVQVRQTGGWLSMMQHYFFAAVIPPAGEEATFIGKPSRTRGFLAQVIGNGRELAPGEQVDFDTQLFIGPKLQRRLADIAPGLELTVDYGILTPVSEPLFWLLDWFFRLTGNWGASIILLTLAVKLALFKLSEAQYRSMAKMRKYAPRIQDLKERYADDREGMHKAMMELYKKEKFNPLAGCWPLLIQFPVFIALYWVLLESVELRQADFALWLNDLSAPDPYFVLPVLFGVTMFAQQKLSGNVAMDPMQQRVMNLMPVMLTVFFAFFPVGLVLYWFVSNLIGIAQQWYITRKLDREGLGKR